MTKLIKLTLREELLQKLQAYSEKSGLSNTQLGMRAAYNPALISRLSEGADITTATYELARDFLEKNGGW